MRHINQGVSPNRWCLSPEETQDFLHQAATHEIELQQNDVICLHCETPPTDSFFEAFSQPVLASDGHLYERATLVELLKNGNNFYSSHTLEPLEKIGKHFFLPVCIARPTHQPVPSRLDPRRMLPPAGALVLVGRNERQVDSAALFIEKRIECQHSSFTHGEITAYQLQKCKGDNNGARIQITSYANKEYTHSTQEKILVQDFGIEPQQIEGRSFSCTSDEIRVLEQQIQQDVQKTKAGAIRYHHYSGKFFFSLFYTTYNSCSWTTHLLHAAHLLVKNQDLHFEECFPITIHPPSHTDLLWGSTPDHALPKQDRHLTETILKRSNP